MNHLLGCHIMMLVLRGCTLHTQVVQMEQVVLQELGWKLVCPTCATFLPWLAKAARSDRECELLAHVSGCRKAGSVGGWW